MSADKPRRRGAEAALRGWLGRRENGAEALEALARELVAARANRPFAGSDAELRGALREWTQARPAEADALLPELLGLGGGRGAYYTPPEIARWIVRATLQAAGPSGESYAARWLDPSCGGGVFLLAAFDELTARHGARDPNAAELPDNFRPDDFPEVRQGAWVVERQLFGVELQPEAANWAKTLLESRAPGARANVATGDALRFFKGAENQAAAPTPDFPEDFGVVLGNPPYLGEKGRKALFDEIRETELARRFYRGKMDYAYFFFHLGLDLLRPGGTLAYLSAAYYLTATNAAGLRADLAERARPRLLFDFGEARLFRGAPGHHSLLSVYQKKGEPDTSVNSAPVRRLFCKAKGLLEGPRLRAVLAEDPAYVTAAFAQDRLADAEQAALTAGRAVPLGEIARLLTGVMGGCDRLTRRRLDAMPEAARQLDWQAGDGVFVLDENRPRDRAALALLEGSPFLKPFYKSGDVVPFGAKTVRGLWLVFSTLQNRAADDPAVRAHLERFRPALESVRARNREPLRLWACLRRGGAHPEAFEAPKIVCPQRAAANCFGWTTEPFYASADVYFILSPQEPFTFDYLLGLLNSGPAWAWHRRRGKRKGRLTEFYREPLSRFPVPVADQGLRAEVAGLAACLRACAAQGEIAPDLRAELDAAAAAAFRAAGLGELSEGVQGINFY